MDTNALYITTTALVISSILQPIVAADGTCNGLTDFWDLEENVCKRCTMCYPGTQSTEKCGRGHGSQGRCEDCKENFYQDKYDTVDACTKCTVCDQAEGIILAPCEKDKDRQCGCKPGFAAFPQQLGLCVKCEMLPDPPDSCQQYPTSTTLDATLKNKYYTTILSGTSLTAVSTSNSDLIIIIIVYVCVFGFIFVPLLAFACYRISRGRNQSIHLSPGNHHPCVTENGIALHENGVTPAPTTRDGHQVTITNADETKETCTLLTTPDPRDPCTLVTTQNADEETTETCTLLTTPNINRSPNSANTPDNSLNSSGGSRKLVSNAATNFLMSTPKNTPPLTRSLSAPAGDPKSTKNSPQTEGMMPVLSEETRTKAIQYGQTVEEKALEEKKQKAKSIGAGLRLEDLRYDISKAIGMKLAIQEDKASLIEDWRKLAVCWGYSTNIDGISICKASGFETLVEMETAQKPRTKSLENLIDDLESIKRMDVASALMDYLLNYKPN